MATAPPGEGEGTGREPLRGDGPAGEKGTRREATEQSLAHAMGRSRTITPFITQGWAPRRRRWGAGRLTRNKPSSMLEHAALATALAVRPSIGLD